MTVYHISKNGEPARCSALVKACPLGGEHFTSLVDAKNYLEARELQENQGSFSQAFSKSKRERMFHNHKRMTYAVNIDDSVYDSEGNEWVVIAKYYGRSEDRDHVLPTISLARVQGGREVTIDPYNDSSVTLEDFSMPIPAPVVLDGPPKITEKVAPIPRGKSEYSNAHLLTIPVTTSLKGEQEFRYIVVTKPEGKTYFTQREMLELGQAMWAIAGRDESQWVKKSKADKLKYFEWNSTEHKTLAVVSKNTVQLFGKTTVGTNYALNSAPIKNTAIFKYTL